jgi:Flp pilus assembly protein TadB
MTERVWMILAGVLLVAAAVFLWWNNLSAAFVTAALGACAWFLSYRAELRKKIKDNDSSDEESEDSNDELDQE